MDIKCVVIWRPKAHTNPITQKEPDCTVILYSAEPGRLPSLFIFFYLSTTLHLPLPLLFLSFLSLLTSFLWSSHGFSPDITHFLLLYCYADPRLVNPFCHSVSAVLSIRILTDTVSFQRRKGYYSLTIHLFDC